MLFDNAGTMTFSEQNLCVLSLHIRPRSVVSSVVHLGPGQVQHVCRMAVVGTQRLLHEWLSGVVLLNTGTKVNCSHRHHMRQW